MAERFRPGAPPANPVVLTIEDEGVSQGTADTLDFVGAGVSVVVAGSTATVTIAGGGGAGDEPTTSDWML